MLHRETDTIETATAIRWRYKVMDGETMLDAFETEAEAEEELAILVELADKRERRPAIVGRKQHRQGTIPVDEEQRLGEAIGNAV